MPLEVGLGDVVELRKPHPCGSRRWQVIRLGSEIGLRCLGCQRRVFLERHILERRLKVVSKASLTAEVGGPKMSNDTPPLEGST